MQYKVFKLKNGLDIILSRCSFANTVYFDLSIKAGSRYESSENNGISHLVEHIFSKKIIDSLQKHSWIKSYINDNFYSYTNEDRTSYEFKILKNDLVKILQAISLVFKKNDINKKEVFFEKEVIREELVEKEMDYFYNFNKIIKKKLYRNNSLMYDVLGSKRSLKKISLFDIKKFIDNFYVPENMILSICGDLDFHKTLNLLEKINFPSSNKTTKQIINFKSYSYRGDSIEIISKDKFKQGFFSWHVPYFNNLAEKNVKLEFLLEILNNYLFYNLQQSFPLYSLDVNLRSFSDFADCYIEASLSSVKMVDFYTELYRLLEKFYRSFKEKDLKNYKEKKINSLLLTMDDPVESINMIGWYLLTFGVRSGFDLYEQKKIIESVSLKELKELFNDIFLNKKGVVVIFGNFSKVKEKKIYNIWQNG